VSSRRIPPAELVDGRLIASTDTFRTFLVPSSFVYENLMRYVPEENRSHVVCFEHPIFFGDARMDDPVPFSEGSFCQRSRDDREISLLIFELADKANRVNRGGALRFALVGRVEEEVSARSNGLVDFRKSGTLLSFEDFAAGVRNADYLLYFIPRRTVPPRAERRIA
jgi:hypothetical protein